MAVRGLALAGLLCALLAGPAAGTAAAACSAPAKATAYDNVTDYTLGFARDVYPAAQSFKVPAAVEVTKVSLYIEQRGTTGDSLIVELRAAGSNSFRFTGKLRGRKLRPGRYALVATPTRGRGQGQGHLHRLPDRQVAAAR